MSVYIVQQSFHLGNLVQLVYSQAPIKTLIEFLSVSLIMYGTLKLLVLPLFAPITGHETDNST